MAEPNWGLFAGVSIVLAVALLGLARATGRALTTAPSGKAFTAGPDSDGGKPADNEVTQPRVQSGPVPDEDIEASRPADVEPGAPPTGSTALLVNAALSHALFGGLLVAIAWYARIPPAALGIGPQPAAFPLGIGLGVGLYLANEVAATVTAWSGLEHSERLRELLAPTTAGSWVLLLVVVLPVIAGVEELLFRAALIGALSAGYDLPAWGLAVGSSALFGLGHGLQGPGGILVTGALGLVLAAAFVLTESLTLVIVAHYAINALEFVVHEGIGVELRPERDAG